MNYGNTHVHGLGGLTVCGQDPATFGAGSGATDNPGDASCRRCLERLLAAGYDVAGARAAVQALHGSRWSWVDRWQRGVVGTDPTRVDQLALEGLAIVPPKLRPQLTRAGALQLREWRAKRGEVVAQIVQGFAAWLQVQEGKL